MFKKFIKGVCIVCMMIMFVVMCLPKVHNEHCEVIGSSNGIVRLMTDDGNVYEVYGTTTASEVEAVFEDDRVVGFEVIR